MQALVDRTEQIKWWDALDKLEKLEEGMLDSDLEAWLRCVRDCLHPDARWLASLFPDEPFAVTKQAMLSVMKAQGNDPRALYLCSQLAGCVASLQRAAELGYAPAQASWARECRVIERLAWAEKAAAQGDRRGLFVLGRWLWNGIGCDQDRGRALALMKEAAELEDSEAQFSLGEHAYSEREWQRYRWWGRAVARENEYAMRYLQKAVLKQLKRWDEGKGTGRNVFELGSAFKGHVDVANKLVFGGEISGERMQAVQRCIEVHDEWCKAAKAAIECWIGVGRRLEVMKDIRLVIAGLVWKHRAEWGKR